LKLAVNVRTLHPGRIGGLEFAFRRVFDHLVGRADADLAITLLTSESNDDSFGEWSGSVERVVVRSTASADELHDRLARFDLLYCPLLFLDPEEPPIPSVVAIPDLQHLTYPEFFPPEILGLRLRRLRPSAVRARRVLTISEFSRDEIVRAFHLPAERVAVTPLDCGPEFRRPRDPERLRRVRERHRLPESWLFYPANDWPHKNHATLFRALAILRQRTEAAPALILTGARVAGTDLEGEARRAGVADLVRHLGWIDADELPDLYDGACCVPFVSLFEGFGMPVVEAMRRNSPLLLSDRTSLPEVSGGHALLVNAADPAAIAGGLERILGDREGSAARASAAHRWAERYSFARAAEQTLALFRAAVAEEPPLLSLATVDSPPRVFVVTPSFRQARYLKATVDSVLAQDYPQLDYFVADGGSDDGSVELLRSYGDRVRFRSAPDGGQAAAIADAWGESSADIVAWLNSDDTYLPGAVSRAVDHFLRQPDAALVYGRSWHIDEEGRTIGSYPTRPFDAALLRHDCFISQPAAFVRRDVFHRIALPDRSLRYCMDYDLWIRLSQEFPVAYVEDYLACSRVHAETKSLRERQAVYLEILGLTRRHFGIVPRNWLAGEALHRNSTRLEATFRWLSARIRSRMTLRLAAVQERRTVSTLYGDGWAGTRSVVEVRPDERGMVRIVGQSPYWPYVKPLEVKVEWEERVLAHHRCWRRGEFALDFRLPAAAIGSDGSARVVLRANRTFVPAAVGWAPDDPRPLSFRVLDGAR
jgi:glycosyltransferase involved in cell wall biosynthesis